MSVPSNDFQKVKDVSHPIESPFEDSGNEKPLENIIINNENDNNNVAQSVSHNNAAQNNSANSGNKSSVTIDNTNTLDEPVSTTLKRDLIRIYTKLRYVVIPKLNRTQDELTKLELKNWDLWGPLIFTLLLCM